MAQTPYLVLLASVLLYADLTGADNTAVDPISPAEEICSVQLRFVEVAAKRKRTDLHKISELSHNSDGLADIQMELESLPFDQYRLLAAETKKDEIGADIPFELPGPTGEKHSILITPTEHSSRRIKFGVAWSGPKGENLLHTQLTVENGRAMVFGSDNDCAVGPRPVVVAANVHCM